MSHYEADPEVLDRIAEGAQARLDALMAEGLETLRLQAADKPEPTLTLKDAHEALIADQKRLAEMQLAQRNAEHRIQLLAEERLRLSVWHGQHPIYLGLDEVGPMATHFDGQGRRAALEDALAGPLTEDAR